MVERIGQGLGAWGGALFVYNLPKWLVESGAFLNSIRALTFKHWIAIDKADSLPIPNRLSPKGPTPRTFDRDSVRIPNYMLADTVGKT